MMMEGSYIDLQEGGEETRCWEMEERKSGGEGSLANRDEKRQNREGREGWVEYTKLKARVDVYRKN